MLLGSAAFLFVKVGCVYCRALGTEGGETKGRALFEDAEDRGKVGIY